MENTAEENVQVASLKDWSPFFPDLKKAEFRLKNADGLCVLFKMKEEGIIGLMRCECVVEILSDKCGDQRQEAQANIQQFKCKIKYDYSYTCILLICHALYVNIKTQI